MNEAKEAARVLNSLRREGRVVRTAKTSAAAPKGAWLYKLFFLGSGQCRYYLTQTEVWVIK